MSDVIGDLRRQMQQRLKEIERELDGVQALLREQEQIRAALAQPPFSDHRPAARRSPARRGRKRAPRGANREAILSTVSERPGVSAAEIADVTKISRAVTYNTLAKLVQQGLIVKTELPSGQSGYRAAADAPTASA